MRASRPWRSVDCETTPYLLSPSFSSSPHCHKRARRRGRTRLLRRPRRAWLLRPPPQPRVRRREDRTRVMPAPAATGRVSREHRAPITRRSTKSPGQRREAAGGVDVRDGRQGRVPDQQPDRRRRALHGVARAKGHRAGRGDRQGALEVRSDTERRTRSATGSVAWSTGRTATIGASSRPPHVALRARRPDRAPVRTFGDNGSIHLGQGWASTARR